jgi:hypothetical protein
LITNHQLIGTLLAVGIPNECYNFFFFYENAREHGCWIYHKAMVFADNGGYDYLNRYSV